MENRALPHIAAIFTVSVWGVTFVCTKVLLDYLTPFEILLARSVLAFVALCLMRPHILKLDRPLHELLAAVAGFTGVFGYYFAENTALEFADASFVSVAVSTAPLFTAILGFAIIKEKGFNARFIVGFAIAIAGVALISLQEGPAHASPTGIALSLVAALLWAAYSIVVKYLSNQGYETIALTKRLFAWGLLFMVAGCVIAGDIIPVEPLANPIVFGNLAFLGLLASAGCFITWNYSVKHLGASAASAYIYLQVPMSVIWAVALLGEPINGPIAFGIALVIAGLALSEGFDTRIREQLSHRHEH